jgi:hypothetical protein
MSGELKTQGSELYLLDTSESPERVLKISNLTTVDSLGGSASDIDITNLDSQAREYLVGLQDNGTASFGLNLNPRDDSHQKIFEIAGGARYRWAIGCSDGTAPPTIAAGDPPIFTLPTTRTWFTFEASVQEATRSFTTDDAIRIQGGLRVSGAILMTPSV